MTMEFFFPKMESKNLFLSLLLCYSLLRAASSHMVIEEKTECNLSRNNKMNLQDLPPISITSLKPRPTPAADCVPNFKICKPHLNSCCNYCALCKCRIFQTICQCLMLPKVLRQTGNTDPKGYRWAFGIAALETEEINQLSTLPGLSEDPSVVGLLKVKDKQVPIATTTVHRQQYHTNQNSLMPIHKLIHQLESQGVISKTHSPFNSPIWPVRNSNGEWRPTVDYHGLSEVTPPLSPAVPDMVELQYELESKAGKWYGTTDIANAFFSIPTFTMGLGNRIWPLLLLCKDVGSCQVVSEFS
ncbi:PREDICTED: LOW QUALITY PROTEIN: agouti-signaling protein [Pygoscelis adeliae]|uniref:LOW QUALITY PROTEIN: agouti-signaling protein n=1 Tax=Pygoscelis adeliae TaxID=9238 RepID=UPI0004F4D8A9|nr:PREDICTED: LOW QUALITY PROTEIN: agouti-signaling protein [Pygoscelis adeliae]